MCIFSKLVWFYPQDFPQAALPTPAISFPASLFIFKLTSLDCGLSISFKRTTKLRHTLSSQKKKQMDSLKSGPSLSSVRPWTRGRSCNLRCAHTCTGRGQSAYLSISISTRNTSLLVNALLQVPAVAGKDQKKFIHSQEKFVVHGQQLTHRDHVLSRSPLVPRAAGKEGTEGSSGLASCCPLSWEIRGIPTILCE